MIIYRFAGKIFLEKNAVNARLHGRDDYSYVELDQEVRYIAFCDNPYFSDISIDFNHRRYVKHYSGRPDYESVLDGINYVEPISPNTVKLSPEIQYALLSQPDFKLFAFYVSSWDNPGVEESLVLCDRVTESSKYRSCAIIAVRENEGYIYGLDASDDGFYCLDQSLDVVWKWHDEKERRFTFQGGPGIIAPMFCNEHVIYYFGIQETEQNIIDGRPLPVHKYALLNVFNKYTGQLIWSLDLEFKIEHMVTIDGNLYVSTNRRILVYEITSGKLLKEVEVSPLETLVRQFGISNNTFYYENDVLFYCDMNAQMIRLYDKNLIGQGVIKMPGDWAPKNFQFKDERTGCLYFDIVLSDENKIHYHRDALLELDPKNLTDSAEMEPEPQISVEVRPSESDSGLEELWVEIECESLDDALRFGEIYTQDYVYVQGKTMIQHCDENPKFNGKVHFRYSGSASPREEIEEKMKIMEKRFDRWNSKALIYSGEGKARLCTLDAKYIP